MKKNLLAIGLMASLCVVACKDKKDETYKITTCASLSDGDFKDGCVRCSTKDDKDSTYVVCGKCDAAAVDEKHADHFKRQCVASVEGAKEYSQTVICYSIDDVAFYVEYQQKICTDVEVCNKDKGICMEDASRLDVCNKPLSWTCEGQVITPHYDESCPDDKKLEKATDCTNRGGCDAAHEACKHENGICEDDEKNAAVLACDEMNKNVVKTYVDKACIDPKQGVEIVKGCNMITVCLKFDDASSDDCVAMSGNVAGVCKTGNDGVAACVKKNDACGDGKTLNKFVCVPNDDGASDIVRYNSTCGDFVTDTSDAATECHHGELAEVTEVIDLT